MIASFLLSFLILLLSWFLIAFLFSGIGALLRRLWRLPVDDLETFFRCFWMGYALVVLLLQIYHLVFPINHVAAIGVACLGAYGLWVHRRGLRLAAQEISSLSPWHLLPAALFLLWFANRCLGPVLNADFTIYHLRSVRWLQAYPIIPGLGNLDLLLAYNQTSFLYDALLEAAGLSGHSHSIANSALLLVMLCQAGWACYRFVSSGKEDRGRFLPWTFALFPLLLQLFSGHFNGFSPEMTYYGLSWALLEESLRILTKERPTREILFAGFVILLLSTFGLTVKISFGAIGFFCSVFAILTLWSQRKELGEGGIRSILSLAGIVIVGYLGIWCLRGVIQSGYPFFPLDLFAWNVDWRIPREELVWLRHILFWVPREITLEVPGHRWIHRPELRWNHWEWVIHWLRYKGCDRWAILNFWLPLGLSIVGMLGICRRYGIRVLWHSPLRIVWPWLFAGIGWFITGPDLRYGAMLFWCLAAGIGCGLFDLFPFSIRSFLSQRAIEITLWSILALMIGLYTLHKPDRSLPVLVGKFDPKRFAPIPPCEYTTFETDWGLTLYRPLYLPNSECGDPPLLFTLFPEKVRYLRLREPPNLRQGFRLQPLPPPTPND